MRPRDSIAGREVTLEGARRLGAVVASAALAGCLATDPTSPPAAVSAHDKFTQNAWPALGRCLGCHGSQPAIDFLAPGTADGAYATLFAFQPPVVNLDSPSSSLLLTMGKHTGPPLEPNEAATLLDWLDRERDERAPPAEMPIVIGPVTVTLDTPSSIDLGHGAKLSFLATAFEGHLDLTQVAIATTTSALHVSHPLFVSRPVSGAAVIDQADHFEDLDEDIAASSSLPLTSATFLDFAATDPITIHFLQLESP